MLESSHKRAINDAEMIGRRRTVFNENLIKRRRALAMTQDELADKLGVSRQSVSKWENGECMPDSDKLIRLADILEISLDELTGREVASSPVILPPVETPPKKSALPGILASAALLLLIGAGCFLLGRYLFPYSRIDPEPDPIPTEAVTQVPALTTAPSETAAATDVPEKAVYNRHDYLKVLEYLEESSWNKKNGERLNAEYDPDDPATWCYEYLGEIHFIADWDDEGYMTSFTALVDGKNICGNIDLSGCERLDRVEISNYNMGALDLSGCPLGEGVYLHETSLHELSPVPIETPVLEITNSEMKHILWKSVPMSGKNNTGWGVLDLEAEGPGFVGMYREDSAHHIGLVIVAIPEETECGTSFIGWFDENGELITEEIELDITELVKNARPRPFVFTARFE